jgi:hypothetical protein
MDPQDALTAKLNPIISGLSQQELEVLKELVDKRLKFIHAASGFVGKTPFKVGDKVSFITKNGATHKGTLRRISPESAIVEIQRGVEWEINLQLLKKEE